MKKVNLSLLVVLLFMFALASTTLAFQNEPEEFRGLKWGDPPGEDMELETEFVYVYYWYEKHGAYYSREDMLQQEGGKELSSDEAWQRYVQSRTSFRRYERKNDKLKIGEAELGYIYYEFYEGQFMGVAIWIDSGFSALKDTLELKFGRGKNQGAYVGPLRVGDLYKWSGDVATIELRRMLQLGIYDLKIYSTKIWSQKREDERRQEEETRYKKEEERQKAAEEGLADFDYIPETKEEEKESNIKEKPKAEKLKKIILNGEEASDEEKIKPILPEVQPFFDLSTPENTVRSFIEAIILEDDNKKAIECWSRKVPEFLVIALVNVAQEAFKEGIGEESLDPEIVKFGLNLFSYEKEQINGESFYVWYIAPDGSDSKEDLNFRVVKEDGNWKILMQKGMEDNPLFSSLLEKVETTERKFRDFSTPENTLRTFLEAAILRDKELMKQCWSKEIPERILDETLEGVDSIFAEYDLEERKSFLGKITYKVDRYIDDSTCYVYGIIEEENFPVKFKVKKEEEEWKILMPIEEEENEGPGKDSEEREGIRGNGQGPEIEGLVAGREIRRWVQPGFPRSAEEQGKMDGKVRVKLWVLPSGEVVETMIIQTSGVPEFDQDASQALMKWIFERIEEEETQTGIVTFRFKKE